MYNLADEGVQFSPTQLFIQSRRGCSASNGRGVQLGRYIQVLILPYKNGYLSTVCCDIAFHYLSKGAIPPHLPESNEQNLVVIEAFLEAAKRYARGGYDVIVDGIVGPWFLEPWKALVREHYEVHYIILRASKEETLKRAVERSKLDRKTNIELVETMWEQFCNLGIYESNVVDTTNYSIQETVSAVQEKIASRAALLS